MEKTQPRRLRSNTVTSSVTLNDGKHEERFNWKVLQKEMRASGVVTNFAAFEVAKRTLMIKARTQDRLKETIMELTEKCNFQRGSILSGVLPFKNMDDGFGKKEKNIWLNQPSNKSLLSGLIFLEEESDQTEKKLLRRASSIASLELCELLENALHSDSLDDSLTTAGESSVTFSFNNELSDTAIKINPMPQTQPERKAPTKNNSRTGLFNRLVGLGEELIKETRQEEPSTEQQSVVDNDQHEQSPQQVEWYNVDLGHSSFHSIKSCSSDDDSLDSEEVILPGKTFRALERKSSIARSA